MDWRDEDIGQNCWWNQGLIIEQSGGFELDIANMIDTGLLANRTWTELNLADWLSPENLANGLLSGPLKAAQ